jgi:putative transposase
VREITPDVVFTLLAHNHLYVDVSAAPLVEREAVCLYPDRATAEAHALLAASRGRAEAAFEGERPSEYLVLTATTRVLWDGRLWTLLNLGHTTVTLRPEEGPLLEIPLPSFLHLIAAGSVTVPRTTTGSALAHLHPEAQRLLRAASLRDLEIANHRYPLVVASRAQKRGETWESTVPARTLRSWVARFEEAEARYGTGYVGLLPRTARSGNRARRAPADTQELLDTLLLEQFATPTPPHARAVYFAYCRACAERGLAALSERTCYRRLHQHRGEAQTRRRTGARAAYQEQPLYLELPRSTPRHADRPWQIVHLDHTQLDGEVCTALGRVLGRPWATFAVDAYSRRMLACYLTFAPPS